jgi:death-on-curing protein
MRYLTIDEVLELHRLLLKQSGGAHGVLNQGAVESAVAQPQMTFGGQEIDPRLGEKAAAHGFSLVKNHAVIDGNKRVGHAVIDTFLVLNAHELQADVDEQEQVILSVAASTMGRDDFTRWIRQHLVLRPDLPPEAA